RRVAGTNAAVIIDQTKVYIYSDFSLGNDGLHSTIDRFEFTSGNYFIENLVNTIELTGLFECDIILPSLLGKRSMTLLNQSNVRFVSSEDISIGGSRIKLANRNLLTDSISVSSPSLNQ